MGNLVQLSVKINPETLEKIDKLSLQLRYYKRNTLINKILTNLLYNCSEEDVKKLIRWWEYEKKYKLKINVEMVDIV